MKTFDDPNLLLRPGAVANKKVVAKVSLAAANDTTAAAATTTAKSEADAKVSVNHATAAAHVGLARRRK